jgi:hypothetical protein
MAAPAVAPRLTEAPCAVAQPWACSGRVEGTSSRTTLTTPPSALEPYRSDIGPRTTSMARAVSGSIATPWSAEVADRSPGRCPSSSTRMRSPDRPRITGRAVAGPSEPTETPGCPWSVAAIVPSSRRSSAASASTDVGLSTSCRERSTIVPVTTEADSCTGEGASTSSTVLARSARISTARVPAT